jgi:hypothetical protein
MTRYIHNLPNLGTADLTYLYKMGVRSIDSTMGDDNISCLSCSQIDFVGKLLTRRGVDIDALLDAVLGPE